MLIWVHDDALGPTQLVFERFPKAAAAYVFDDQVIEHRHYGLKRLHFIAGCLATLNEHHPVATYHGDTAQTLASLAKQSGTDIIATMATPCPKLGQVMGDLEVRHGLSLTVVEPTPLVQLESEPDLKRFSRYWRQAQKSAFKHADLPLFKRPQP
ncbi:MAG: hypothetical protein KI792_13980 [Alphaproteobacteria bacterium]|nr:hypothetical protein [Alphaproteobacteria bacterium SS10]